MSEADSRLDPFDYRLPKEAIARFPPEQRDGGRLLMATEKGWVDGRISDLVQSFSSGDVLVVNDTRVLSARLYGCRQTGGRVEVLLLGTGDGSVPAMVRPSRKLSVGESIALFGRDGQPTDYTVTMGEVGTGGSRSVELSHPASEVMSACGRVPLPPYMERPATEADEERYQTVFAAVPGAVAAPTASLHLTPAILKALKSKGVGVHTITLHVGAGTFRNLRSEDLDRGALHSEWYEIPGDTAAAIQRARARGAKVTAVGTTVTRTLEASAQETGEVVAGSGRTCLFIKPGFSFQVVDRLMTNFHLPRSSLLMLVCAFGGRDTVLTGYSDAVNLGYRFYSYGDAMLIERGEYSKS